jgi:hypothetical protein
VTGNALGANRRSGNRETAYLGVVSPRTHAVTSMMLYSLIVLGLLDHLAKTGAIPNVGVYAAGVLALAPLIMTVIVVPVARRLDQHGPGLVRWTLMGLGMTSVAVGNVIFLTLFVTTGRDPYPGVAEVFTLGMYGFFAAAFYSALKARWGRSTTKDSVLASVAVIGVLGILGYFFVGPCLLSARAGLQPLGLRVFNTLYLVLDAVALLGPCVALSLLARRLRIGDGVLPVWLLLASACLLTFADLTFACASCSGVGRTALVDVGYALAPLLVGVAVLVADDVSTRADKLRSDGLAQPTPPM